MPMIDEAARCMQEKIVRRARELDMAMCLGIGFPAFRGGPLRYADDLGIKQVVERMERVNSETGAQRDVCSLLLKMRDANRGFYSMSNEGKEN
jgi:3-hydroxyacyl-CoA dehydrogenase / enoyl-CoA hydratase / 3-hydroxybutyryl-CoA epimerase